MLVSKRYLQNNFREPKMHAYMAQEKLYGAHNYEPIPVVLARGEGVYVWDIAGKRYIDVMSAYSAVSHGHCHPKILESLKNQAEKLTMVSRAYYNDQLGKFLEKICKITHQDKALPMNTGAEGVETALKAARKWAYQKKKVPDNLAEIIVCEGNFHGRTISIISMSSEKNYRNGFGPFTPGFKLIPYGDVKALKQAITPYTAAFLVEPIQGEGGIIVPPSGYLKACQEVCRQHNVLLICDEVQTGMGRTGKFLASEHENVQPDGVILGKALGGGVFPVSVFLSRNDVMEVFTPGDHGSTFGGNPLAAHIAITALDILFEENLIQNSFELGEYFLTQLKQLSSPIIQEVRGKGLLVGLSIHPEYGSARDYCLRLMDKGILSKETHQTVIRLAPPLVITKKEIEVIVEKISEVLTET